MAEYIVRESGYPGTIKQEIVGELVRCKDCKHRIIESNDDWCECTGCDINPDGFCEEGERIGGTNV